MSRLSRILFLFAALSLLCFIIVRFLAGGWVPFLWIALGLFVGFSAGGVFNDRRFFGELFGMKTTKQGMSMGAMLILVVVLLGAVNFIAAKESKTWDFSLAQVNTLSGQSIQLLKSLTEDLNVIYFYKEGTEGLDQNRRAFIDLIRKYQDQTPKVKLQFIEVNQRPDLTEKYNVNKGTQAVLLEYKGRTSLIEKIDEQELTSGLVKVTREKEKKVFFLSGHGELGLESLADGLSMSLLKQLLESSRYKVESFSLTTVPAIPADADAVIIAGPKQDFIEVEIKALEDYMRKGGSLILAMRPKSGPVLQRWVAKFGVEPQNNYIATVLDTPMGRAVDPRSTRGSQFSQNKITKPFGLSQYVVFHLPQALKTAAPGAAGLTIDNLVGTNQSAMSFADTSFKTDPKPGPFVLGVDITGPFPGTTETAKPFELLVFGDADFMDDQYLYQNLNRDLVLNSISALTHEENLISISPKEVQATKFEMSNAQFILYIFAFIIPLPILLFFTSGVVWFRRRHA